MRADFDHVSFAVKDAIAWGRSLRRQLGVTPIGGEVLPEFRFILMHLGTATTTGRIELMEPVQDGFLTRYLDQHGEGPHHITFTVPDLRAAVARVKEFGARVVKEDYGHTPWQEAFIFPDSRHNIVIQLAQSDRTYPAPAELMTTRERDVESFPSARGATDLTWWEPVWTGDTGPAATLARIRLAATDPGFSEALFGDVLGGEAAVVPDGTEYHWPGGTLLVSPQESAGLQTVELADADAGLRIGPTELVNRISDVVERNSNSNMNQTKGGHDG